MTMYDLICKKQRGEALSDAEIEFIVNGYTRDDIPDYQMSAFLMAVLFRGMTDDETAALTYSMMRSGDTVDLGRFGDLTVDKHSTGGVGDKTTLIVAPIAASCGLKVAKMSGRGLGHTGGTVDKLESIPGYRTDVSMEDFLRQVERVGIHVIAQSGNLAPADKKIYALRDVTATVNSMPLIVSSIMSKKLAAGSHSIVLDVKCGSGAFMKTPEDAHALAEKMISIGRICGRRTSAFITDMDTPLGHAVGNSLEVEEALSVLTDPKGRDLEEVSLALAGKMISLGLGLSDEEGLRRAEVALRSGAAAEKFFEWIAASGGDVSLLEKKQWRRASVVREVLAPTDGYIDSFSCDEVGSCALGLGAGRRKKEDVIDHSAGVIVLRKTGERVSRGEVIATLHTSSESLAEEGERRYLSAVKLSETPPAPRKIIYDQL